MLNPFAHEFKPIESDPLPNLPKTAAPEKRKENKRKERKKVDNRQAKTTTSKPNGQSSSTLNASPKHSLPKQAPENKITQPNGSNNTRIKPPKKACPPGKAKPSQGSGSGSSFTDPLLPNSSRRHSKKNEEGAITLAPVPLIFDTPSKFITIETAVYPVFQTRPEQMKERGQNGHSSGAASGLTKLDHGYERYIGWIERSLKAFGTVTLVGMESAIVDVVSMVTILQNRSIGEHEGRDFSNEIWEALDVWHSS